MKGNRKFAVATALATSFALVSAPACAQTTAPGPYYATPSWDQQLPVGQRFIVLSNWNNFAVLDRETGLVWQRTIPPFGINDQEALGSGAIFGCHLLGARALNGSTPSGGGRAGWRLPRVEELTSLIDLTQQNPALPAGHPFQGVNNEAYWTSTPDDLDSNALYTVHLGTGLVTTVAKSAQRGYWCVRGGQGIQ